VNTIDYSHSVIAPTLCSPNQQFANEHNQGARDGR